MESHCDSVEVAWNTGHGNTAPSQRQSGTGSARYETPGKLHGPRIHDFIQSWRYVGRFGPFEQRLSPHSGSHPETATERVDANNIRVRLEVERLAASYQFPEISLLVRGDIA